MIASMVVTITMALLVAWQWAESEAILDAPPTVALAPGETDALALTTPLLSVRRAPAVLSRAINVASFRDDLDDLFDDLNDTSCASFAIDGQVVASKNETVSVIPGSNMKLFVAAVALEVLGPDFIFTTRATGEIQDDGAIHGDLYLIGGGDPLLATDWWPGVDPSTYPPFHLSRLEDLADALVARGLKEIRGVVVGDGNRYDDERYPPTWDPSIQKVEAGPIDALMVNDGHTNGLAPQLVDDDPAHGAADALTSLLVTRGVTVGGFAVSGQSLSDADLAVVNSAPLSDIVEEMLSTSDDNTAEMLLKEIGLAVAGIGSRQAGLDVMRSVLAEWGIPIEGMAFADGSGLSNSNRVTCQAVVALLVHGDLDDPVGQGLPVAGSSGTLTEAFLGTGLEDRLHAKTGTLTNLDLANPDPDLPAVKALSGYLDLRGDGVIQFSLLLNGEGVADLAQYSPLWYDELAPALAAYPEGPATAALLPR